MIQGWKLAGPQSAEDPKNLAGLLEIGIYFSYLYRFGLLKFLSGLPTDISQMSITAV